MYYTSGMKHLLHGYVSFFRYNSRIYYFLYPGLYYQLCTNTAWKQSNIHRAILKITRNSVSYCISFRVADYKIINRQHLVYFLMHFIKKNMKTDYHIYIVPYKFLFCGSSFVLWVKQILHSHFSRHLLYPMLMSLLLLSTIHAPTLLHFSQRSAIAMKYSSISLKIGPSRVLDLYIHSIMKYQSMRIFILILISILFCLIVLKLFFIP